MIAYQIAQRVGGPYRLQTHPGGKLRAILMATDYPAAALEARRIVRDNPLHFPKSNATE